MTITISPTNITNLIRMARKRADKNIKRKRIERKRNRKESQPANVISIIDIKLDKLKMENLEMASDIKLVSTTIKGQEIEMKFKLKRIKKFRDNKEMILKLLKMKKN